MKLSRETGLSFSPYHFGLFFTQEHVRLAQQNANREPFQSAWAHLSTYQPQDTLYAAQWSAFRYRFGGSNDEAALAIAGLEQNLADTTVLPLLDEISRIIIAAQTYEMLRDHSALSSALRTQTTEWLYAHTSTLHETANEINYVETLWLGLLMLVRGIVLEQVPIFEQGAQVFTNAIANEISPRGYIEGAVKAQGSSAIARTLQAVEALILMAEAAEHVGVDLWGYQVRGVSVTTAAIYPIYYFYVTDKWTWEELEPDTVQAAFRTHGGYLEMLNRKTGFKDLQPLLDDLRPIYEPFAGGLVTLSHAKPPRSRSLFG